MTHTEILDIVKMRLAVYKAGVNAGIWKSLEDNGAREMMDFIFPKSGAIAYYNLIIEVMRNHHKKFIPAGDYSLYKLPVQFEEEIMSYLKSSDLSSTITLPDAPIDFLKSLATITCNHVIDSVNIGTIKDNGIENITKLMAVHYLDIFEQNTNSYPYFE